MSQSIKHDMLKAIGRLPEDATLDDVARLLKMHELLARARADSAAGLGITTEEARKQFGITG